MGMFDSFLLPASDPTNPNANISTPADITRKRALADALVKGGADYSPIASKWQGAARLAQGLIGGYQEGQADRESAAGQKSAREDMASLLQGLGPSTVAPAAPMGSPMPPQAAPPAPGAPPLPPDVASPPVAGRGASPSEADAYAAANPAKFANPAGGEPLDAPPQAVGQGGQIAGPAPYGYGAATTGANRPDPPLAPPVAAPAAPPPSAAAAPATAARSQVDPKALMAVLSNPYSTPAAQQIAQTLLTAQLKPKDALEIERQLDAAGITDPKERQKYILGSIKGATDSDKVKVLGKDGELYKIGEDGKPVILHKNETPHDANISDETADFMADRAIAGDTKWAVGMGRGAQGAENLLKVNERIAQKAKDQGVDAKGILNNVAQQAGLVSATRALGTKETHFGVAEKAMEESIPIARAASAEVPRTQWKMLTQLIQTGQTQINDPKLKKFLIATDTAAKDYARTINPTGALRESDIEYARKIISTADSSEAYNAALDQLQVEAGVMHRAIQRQKGELQGKPGGASMPVPVPGGTGNKTSSGVTWSVE